MADFIICVFQFSSLPILSTCLIFLFEILFRQLSRCSDFTHTNACRTHGVISKSWPWIFYTGSGSTYPLLERLGGLGWGGSSQFPLGFVFLCGIYIRFKPFFTRSFINNVFILLDVEALLSLSSQNIHPKQHLASTCFCPLEET